MSSPLIRPAAVNSYKSMLCERTMFFFFAKAGIYDWISAANTLYEHCLTNNANLCQISYSVCDWQVKSHGLCNLCRITMFAQFMAKTY